MFNRLSHRAVLAAALSLPALLAQPHRVLRGSVSPHVQPQFDRGPAAPETHISEMTLALRRSPEQQAALDRFLTEAQNPASPQYRHFLTPEQFAGRFGASQDDVNKVVAWLESSGFTLTQVARGRDSITFSGSAAQVEAAMHTRMRRYEVKGKMHIANADEPALPESVAGLVAAVHGLNDFRPHPPRRANAFGTVNLAGTPARPDFLLKAFPGTNLLAPDDLATIYNINALYNAGIDGSGQKIAVIGQSDVDMTDVQLFRGVFNLPDNTPRKVLVSGSRNPGINDNAGEAALDLEWAGAIARNASLVYVFSEDAFTSAFFAIDQALAPVVTFSFGACESELTQSDVSFIAAEAQKAAALGITWVASSGDAGAAGCEDQNGKATAATTGLSVNFPASIPEVTGVGGSEFNEGSGSFFASSLRQNAGSALSYIPESSWNDEAFIAKNRLSGFASSGGGASVFFSKPSWQTGPGVPNNGARNVPDVSLNASFFHDPYAMVFKGGFSPNGGTSASAPVFAAILALLNQQLVASGAISQPGLGNINPMLYTMAQNSPDAFHDITSGSNIVPCADRSQDCQGGILGFTAGPGYDQVTGLGSVDAFALVQDWTAQTTVRNPHLVITQFTASTSVRAGGSFSMSITVTNQGQADAGAFQMQALFTKDGTTDTAIPFHLFCDVKGLAAGSSATCAGSITLSQTVTAGTWFLLGVADGNHTVPQSDPAGGTALASTGPLNVTK